MKGFVVEFLPNMELISIQLVPEGASEGERPKFCMAGGGNWRADQMVVGLC